MKLVHDSALLRSLLIEGLIFVSTTLLTFTLFYALSLLVYRRILRVHRVRRARNQLPLAWFLFQSYLVVGLIVAGALPTSMRALGYTSVLMLVLTLVLWGLNRLRTRQAAAKPSGGSLLVAGLLPWVIAWGWQLFGRT
ncbi:MAG TPA: hypothetical protein VIL95_00315 [Bacillota bacterium]